MSDTRMVHKDHESPSEKVKLGDLLEFARPERKTLCLAFVTGIISTSTLLAQPLAVGRVIDAISTEVSIRNPLILFVALFTASALFGGLQSYLLGKAGVDIVFELRKKLVSHLIQLELKTHDHLRSGDLLSRLSTDTAVLRGSLTTAPIEAVFGLLVIAGAGTLMLLLDWVLFSAVAATMLIPALLLLYFLPKLREASKDVQDSVGRMTASLEKVLGAIRTVKASKAETREDQNTANEAKVARDAGVRVARLNASVEPALDLSLQGAFVLTLAIGGVRLASGAITVSELVPFLLYLVFLIGPITQISGFLSELQTGIAAAQRLKEVFAFPAASENQVKSTAHITPQEGSGSPGRPLVEFSAVSFDYGDEAVLKDATFEVHENTKTALVGPSGTGKSTTFALLERFYDGYSGSIFLDGEEIRALPVDRVRDSIGYVEQESPVMAGSIRDNLLYANPCATNEDLNRTLALANLEPVLERSDKGVDSEVGDNGVMLSGGERQRIAIARALLAKPRLLLLDEATSQLDAENEVSLMEAISDFSQWCTVIMISHRLSTVVDADQIIFFDEGEVRNTGTHQDLLKKDRSYKDFVEKQLPIN